MSRNDIKYKEKYDDNIRPEKLNNNVIYLNISKIQQNNKPLLLYFKAKQSQYFYS